MFVLGVDEGAQPGQRVALRAHLVDHVVQQPRHMALAARRRQGARPCWLTSSSWQISVIVLLSDHIDRIALAFSVAVNFLRILFLFDCFDFIFTFFPPAINTTYTFDDDLAMDEDSPVEGEKDESKNEVDAVEQGENTQENIIESGQNVQEEKTLTWKRTEEYTSIDSVATTISIPHVKSKVPALVTITEENSKSHSVDEVNDGKEGCIKPVCC